MADAQSPGPQGGESSGMGKLIVPLLIVAALIAVFVISKGGGEKPGEGGNEATGEGERSGDQDKKPADAGEKGTVKLAYVGWADAIASTNVLAEVLRQEGYEVELTQLDAGVMWQSVSQGGHDAMCAAWLPTTHKEYYDRYKAKIDDLGPNLEGAGLGLVVPAYVEAESIADLKGKGATFRGRVEGIDGGAGIMKKAAETLKAYDLDGEYKLITSSDAAMVAALKGAVENKEPVIVTGWTPHFMFARWDVKYLEDPKGTMGGAETVNTVAREGLNEDMPEAYAILDNFQWKLEDISKVLNWNADDNADPVANAKRWIQENPEKVAAWVK